MQWIQDYGRPWQYWLSDLVDRTPLLRRIKTFLDFASSRDHRRALGENGFRILGPEAAPAVPALTELLNATNRPIGGLTAAFALASIGAEGRPPLLQALASTNRPDQRTILITIREIDNPHNQTWP